VEYYSVTVISMRLSKHTKHKPVGKVLRQPELVGMESNHKSRKHNNPP
jgi:hypothetical protein